VLAEPNRPGIANVAKLKRVVPGKSGIFINAAFVLVDAERVSIWLLKKENTDQAGLAVCPTDRLAATRSSSLRERACYGDYSVELWPSANLRKCLKRVVNGIQS
jgi:hypothetical protein